MKVNSTDIKTNFGKYLDLVQDEDILITRNGKLVAKLMKYYKHEEVIKEGAPDYSYHNIEMTYEEFMEMYENTDGRFEYLNRVVYALASPSHIHQHIIMQIVGEFYNYFKDKKCKPYVAPYDVYFETSETKDVVQPDLFVMCDQENIRNDRYYGVPSLIIEVLSPSTRNKDLVKKLNLYLKAGVIEYIIIDPKNENVIHWNFNNLEVEKCNTLNKNEVFNSNVYEGLEFDISKIFNQ